MKNWRPLDWEELREVKDSILNAPDYVDLVFEAGADTMHAADVQWLRDRLKMTADGSIEILCTRTDWEHFSGR